MGNSDEQTQKQVFHINYSFVPSARQLLDPDHSGLEGVPRLNARENPFPRLWGVSSERAVNPPSCYATRHTQLGRLHTLDSAVGGGREGGREDCVILCDTLLEISGSESVLAQITVMYVCTHADSHS